MTGEERILAAINHREPDRIPYDLSGTTVTSITRNAYARAMQFRGISPEIDTAEVDPVQQIVTPSEAILKILGSDTRRIGAHRIPGYPEQRIQKGTVSEVTDFYVCKWQMDGSRDLYFNQISFPLMDSDTLSGSLYRLQKVSWPDYTDILYRDLSAQIEKVGDNCCIADRNTAGFTENSLRIRGYEKWFLDTLTDLPGVEALLDIILEDKIRYWDEVVRWAEETGNSYRIKVISECDDLGTQTSTILDPGLLRQIVIPRLKSLFSHIKGRLPHVKIFMHTCGSVRELIPDLIGVGMDILNPVQFTATGMDLKALKKDFGDSITFWGGGVDTQSTLNKGTPRQVRDEVRRIIDIMAPGGGFVFAPVHNIQDDVPAENFWAMWDTLREYGTANTL
jgi:uroporphyrinogen decarboxylase